MKIAVFGATGPSGQQVVRQGLDSGHHVVAVVRNPSKLHFKHDNLQIEQGDLFSEDSLISLLEGCDAILSCLGSSPGWPFTTVTLYSHSMKVIVAAMKKVKVTRLVVITSCCTVYDPSHPLFIEWFLKPLFIGRVLRDMAIMENYLETESENINYTIVRPPGLTNGKLDAGETLAREGQFHPEGRSQIPRANVAKFMLDCLNTDAWDRKMVAIALA